MKNTTKRTVAAMSAAVMLMTGGVIGAYGEDAVPISAPIKTAETQETNYTVDHGYIVGKITVGKSLEENTIASSDGSLYLYKSDSAFVLASDGSQKSFDDIMEGDVITYYVDVNSPATLQLPVHRTPDVIVIENEDEQVFREIGVFNEELVNEENTLQLNPGSETAYFSHTRERMLTSGKALVFYDISTRSIPAQTTPIAVVRLADDLEANTDEAVPYGYLTGSFTVGESGEENAIASDDDSLYLYKSEETLVLDANGEDKTFDDIKKGDVITYYVDANAPATLQLPVHYTADVIVIESESSDVSRKIAVFSEELLSDDGSLVISIGDKTKYYSRTKEAMFISGKALIFYDIMLESYPNQTTPLAIVKLAEDAFPAEDEPSEVQTADISGVKRIKAGDAVIDHVPVTVNGVQMLPVRAYAEALGLSVEWINDAKSVYVGHAHFVIDEDSYVMGKAMPQQLGQAPVLIAPPGETNATTYVPVAFFTEILQAEIKADGETAEILFTEAE